MFWHRQSTFLFTSYLAIQAIESSRVCAPPLWPDLLEDAPVYAVLPTGHKSLSILLHTARKTSHRRRTAPPSNIKWSYVFREWVGPLANRWSAMVASNLCSLKISFCSVWKPEGRSTYSGRLGHNFVDFAHKKADLLPDSLFVYTGIKWHIYHRLQQL